MTEKSDRLLLCEKISTKMCHDLSGASMTVANSIEMFNDDKSDDDFKKTAAKIAVRGANAISAKIKFFRVAFGSLGQNDIDNKSLSVLLGNYIHSVSEKAEFFLSGNLSLTAKEAKIIFSIIVFATSITMPSFSLSIMREDGRLTVEIKNAKNFVLPPEVNITDENVRFSELTPNNSSLYLGGILSAEYERKMKIKVSGNLLQLMLE